MPSAVQFSCLAPWSRWLLVCILPSQGTAPNGGLSSRRPGPLRCILAPTVPFAWGSFAPFLSGWHLAVFRPLRYPPHSILGHDSIIRLCVLAESFLSYSIRQEKSTVRPMQNGCVLQDCKNRRSGAESPCFAGKKMYNQGQRDRARKPRDAPRESLSASVREAKEEHCHGNFA